MVKYAIILLGVLLLALGVTFQSPHAFATDTNCTPSPAVINLSQTVTISCVGFTPNVSVWEYSTEPDGFTRGGTTYKADSSGQVTFNFGPFISTPYYALAIGTWNVTIEELAPGGKIRHLGVATFRISGGTEGVSGATLSANPSTIGVTDYSQIVGTGFAPNEIVTAWLGIPHGDCSGTVFHSYDGTVGFNNGASSVGIGDFKANASGVISIPFLLYNFKGGLPCLGTYQIIARGNTSHLGGETDLTIKGNVITETASLVANPSVVSAGGGRVTFYGSGFDANQVVNCWETSPQGQSLPIYVGMIQAPRTDSSGSFSFSLILGQIPYVSEGAVGDTAMTCQSGTRGAIGIARFLVVGDFVDP